MFSHFWLQEKKATIKSKADKINAVSDDYLN